MARLGFYYDQSRCVGCNACQMACKDRYDLEPGLFYRRVETLEYERDGHTVIEHYSGACNHCQDAACIKNCPTGALYYREDKTVGHDGGKCIGCGTCAWACPYGALKLSHKKGIAQKCTSCYERRAEGKKPVCVEACITHCLEFMDLDQIAGTRELTAETLFLPDSSETRPSLLIRRKEHHE